MNLNNADLDVFFDLGDFADEVTRQDGTKFRAIFDDNYFDPELGETVLETTQPRLTCKLADVAGLVRKNFLTVRGVKYSVLVVQPDATGTAMVKLSNQNGDD